MTEQKPDYAGKEKATRAHWLAELGAVAAAHSLIFVIITWPFALSPLTRIIGWPGDNLEHLWSLWWAKHAWLDLRQSLGDVSALYYPLGMDHPLVGATVWNQLTLLPVTLLFGPIIAYNTAVVLAYVLTGLTTYGLIRYLTRNRAGALVGSVIFTFCAVRMSHIYGHLANVTMYLLPLSALALLWLNESPSWRRGVVAGIALSAGMLVNFKLIITFLLPLSLVIGIWMIATSPHQKARRLLALVVATVTAVALWLPTGLPLITKAMEADGAFLMNFGSQSNSVSLLSLLLPSWRNPLLPRVPAITEFAKQANSFWTETLAYIGIPALTLAVLGIRAAGKRVVPWLALVVVCGVLALGPFLKINRDPVMLEIEGAQHKATLPWAFLSQLPLLNLLRTPGRFAQPMMLGIAVLAGFGAAYTYRRLEQRRIIRPALLGSLAFIAAFEGIVAFPTQTFGAPVPTFFKEIARGGKPGALLTYPSLDPNNRRNFAWLGAHLQMFHQTTHERPITSGYVWRVDDAVYGAVNQLENAIHPAPGRDILPKPADLPAYLNSLGFAYVVIYKHQGVTVTNARLSGAPPEDVAQVRSYLVQALGSPVYEDDGILAFETPESAKDDTFLATWRGWYSVEQQPDGTARRWMSGQATLHVRAPVSRTVRMQIEYSPFAPTYTLQLQYGSVPLKLSIENGPQGQLTARSEPFVVGPNEDTIALISPEGCSPIEPIGNRFNAALRFMFQGSS